MTGSSTHIFPATIPAGHTPTPDEEGQHAMEASATPGFERDVKPLFRDVDQESMLSMFDLWSYDEVRENADAIVERLEDGTMPCDEPWPSERIDKFRAWVDGGMPP
jgi:hypothetical protein